jgi:nicotinamidase-related amidase
VLRRAGIERLIFSGIVTNGGVASTLRDAHTRGFDCTLLRDGCAAFNPRIHDATVEALGSFVAVTDCAAMVAAIGAQAGIGSR